MRQQLDTHYYDGKLGIHPLVRIVHNQQKIINDSFTLQKQNLFTRLVQDIKLNPAVPEKYRTTAIKAINVIKQCIRLPANYDRTNGMYADDVLYLVCNCIKQTGNVDTLQYLSEQLSDIMTSGQCSQGRSTRIFQVLLTMDCSTDQNQNDQEKNQPESEDQDPPLSNTAPDLPTGTKD